MSGADCWEEGTVEENADKHGVAWDDTGAPGFRLVLDPSLDGSYREAVLSTEIEILRARIRDNRRARLRLGGVA